MVRGPGDVVEIVRKVTAESGPLAGELVFGFDAEKELVGCAVRGDEPSKPPIDVEQLLLISDELEARALVYVTFRHGATQLPNVATRDRFEALASGCAREGVVLLDHLLVSGQRWRSVAEVSGGRGA